MPFCAIPKQLLSISSIHVSYSAAMSGLPDSLNCWPKFAHANVCCPKAFAGSTSLPPALARRCIPIYLQRARKTDDITQVRRLRSPEEAAPMRKCMQLWAKDHLSQLTTDQARYVPGRNLPTLSPHQRDCSEAFLLLADHIGGNWLEKTTAALLNILQPW